MKNILLIGGSTGIGLELSKKLEDNYNVFISTRNPEKFSSSNIKTTKLFDTQQYTKDFENLILIRILKRIGYQK